MGKQTVKEAIKILEDKINDNSKEVKKAFKTLHTAGWQISSLSYKLKENKKNRKEIKRLKNKYESIDYKIVKGLGERIYCDNCSRELTNEEKEKAYCQGQNDNKKDMGYIYCPKCGKRIVIIIDKIKIK